MSKQQLSDLINDRVDCEDLAERLGLERPGGRGNFRSPHHADKMPSLSCFASRDSVGGRKDKFKDHSANVTGGPIDLYMHVQGCDFVAAVRDLAQMYGIHIERDESGRALKREETKVEFIARRCTEALRDEAKQAAVVDYLKGRGIVDTAIERALRAGTLGYNDWTSPKIKEGEQGHGGPAVATIVRRHDNGEVVAVDVRYLNPELNGGQKTSSQGEKVNAPWCADWRRLRDARTVYVVESAINALTIDSCNLYRTAAIAVRGTGVVESMDWRFLLGKTVVLCFDNDAPQERGPKAGYCAGLSAAWTVHEALTALDIPAMLVDQADWKDGDELISDINDYLQDLGLEETRKALQKLEPWLIAGMPGKDPPGRPRMYLPFHDFQVYWKYRVRPDFTSVISKTDTDEDGTEKIQLEQVCGFRVAGINRIRIASPTATMTGDKDHAPNTVFAVSVQVPRYSDQLLRRVLHDEQLHNTDVWGKFGPIFSVPAFKRMVNILERGADLGAREAINFVGLAWRNGRPIVNEGPDCYFSQPDSQCPYSKLTFPRGPRSDAKAVLLAYQQTFAGNAAALVLVWALGAHLKAFLGFWPHFVVQAEKGAGKSTLVKALERTVGMSMFSGQSLETAFRIMTSISYTSHPVGWEEISARKQELIDKAVGQLQECYQYVHTRRGAELTDYLLCAPVLLAGEDVPVKSLQGKILRNELAKSKRGPKLPDELPAFPVRAWLDYLADLDKAQVQELHRKASAKLRKSCRANLDEGAADRMVENWAALAVAWSLVSEFAGLDFSTGEFMADLIAQMNTHISESVTERQPWIWIVETLLSEISRGTFRYPFKFDTSDGDEEPVLCVRTSHVMDHIAREPSLRDFYNGLPVKSDRVFKQQLKAAGVVVDEAVERTVNKQRVSHMVGMSLGKLAQYGVHAVVPDPALREPDMSGY